MRKGFIGGVTLAIVLFIGLICTLICVEKIPVGYEGVVYSMSGGVQNETLTQGWHIVAPNKKVHLFTVGNEQLVLTKDDRDGSRGDESFNVSTADDASISISFQMSYRFIPSDLVKTYTKFKRFLNKFISFHHLKVCTKNNKNYNLIYFIFKK